MRSRPSCPSLAGARDSPLGLFVGSLQIAEGLRRPSAVGVDLERALSERALEVGGRHARVDAEDRPDRRSWRSWLFARRSPAGGARGGSISRLRVARLSPYFALDPRRLPDEHPPPGARPPGLDLDQVRPRRLLCVRERLCPAPRPAVKGVRLPERIARWRAGPPRSPKEPPSPRGGDRTDRREELRHARERGLATRAPWHGARGRSRPRSSLPPPRSGPLRTARRRAHAPRGRTKCHRS